MATSPEKGCALRFQRYFTRESGSPLEAVTCSKGHPYTEENTYRAKDGSRVCKTCRREWNKKYEKKRRRSPARQEAMRKYRTAYVERQDKEEYKAYQRKKAAEWKQANPERAKAIRKRFYEKHKPRLIQERLALFEKKKEEAVKKFREFVAGLPDVQPNLPRLKRELRAEISMEGVEITHLPPSKAKAPLSARPRTSFRRLSRRGLPLNDGPR